MEKYYFNIMGSVKEQGADNNGWLLLQKASEIDEIDLKRGYSICNGIKYELIPFSQVDDFVISHPGIHLPKNTTEDALDIEDKYLINCLKTVEDFF